MLLKKLWSLFISTSSSFLKWLFNISDPQRRRDVALWINMEGSTVQVGVVSISYQELAQCLKKFDSLSAMTFNIADVDE